MKSLLHFKNNCNINQLNDNISNNINNYNVNNVNKLNNDKIKISNIMNDVDITTNSINNNIINNNIINSYHNYLAINLNGKWNIKFNKSSELYSLIIENNINILGCCEMKSKFNVNINIFNGLFTVINHQLVGSKHNGYFELLLAVHKDIAIQFRQYRTVQVANINVFISYIFAIIYQIPFMD